MKNFRKEQLRRYLRDDFSAQSTETILGWLVANEGRPPVIVVGAGFTRNAIDTRTGMAATLDAIPLWSDVIRRLENDLAIKPGSHEPLTLAELYAEELGPNTLHNALLEMMPDNFLRPGAAHEALAVYNSEAIITTNQLDTVLDRILPQKMSVIQDSDLALYSRSASSKQLIYFHGHRSNLDSWVFTRSQYEDIFKTRPLISTRVRQLLSQHPVLVVGYSLTDPDFHAIYRQISLDMANRHPLGLVILLEEPHAAERRHWESLGMRIVILTAKSRSDGFARFFTADPNGPLPSVETSIDDIRLIENFTSRRRYTEDIFEENDQIIQHAHLNEPLSDHDQYRLWLACVSVDLPVTSTATALNLEAPFIPFLPNIPQGRFPTSWTFTQQLNDLALRSAELRRSLMDWLVVGWKRGLFEADHEGHEQDYINALSWLWRNLAQTLPRDSPLSVKAVTVIKECLSFAHNYRFEDLEKFVIDDARSVGILEENLLVDHEPRRYQGASSDMLLAAYTCAMNGDFAQASVQYRDAAESSRRSGDHFAEWVSVSGQLIYSNSYWEFREQTAEERQESAVLRRKKYQLEQEPSVKRWIEKADKRLVRLEREASERHQRNLVSRSLGVLGWTSSNSAHYAYRTVRDLEILHAPPSLQIKYIEPLLSYDAFSDSIEIELTYRLKFGIDKPPHWLRSKIVEPISDARSRERDIKIASTFYKTPANNTEHLSRLRVVPVLREVLHNGMEERLSQFLHSCREQLDTRIKTFQNESYLYWEYPRAWLIYAQICGASEGFALLRSYAQTIVHPEERSQFCRILDDFPWRRWVVCEEVSPDSLFELVNIFIESDDTTNSLNLDHVGIALSLSTLLQSVREFGKVQLDHRHLKRVREWALQTLGRQNPETFPWPAYQATLRLIRELSKTGDDDIAGARTRLLILIDKEISTADADTFHKRRTMCAALLTELLKDGEFVEVRDQVEAFLQRLNATWAEIISYIKLNPRHPYYSNFLAAAMQSAEGDLALALRSRVLECVMASASALPSLARLLTHNRWGDSWGPLTEEIRRSTGGNRGQDSNNRLLNAIYLFTNWLVHSKSDDVIDVALHSLVDTTLLAVYHENHAIAAAAANALFLYAERKVPTRHLSMVFGALNSISDDPRVDVRVAAAFGVARLKYLSTTKQVRTLCTNLDAKLSQDLYAWVRQTHRYGTAIAAAQQRSRVDATGKKRITRRKLPKRG